MHGDGNETLTPTEPRWGRPGRRDDAASDGRITSRIERRRRDSGPAPLPPSPAAADAARWLARAHTNPAPPPEAPTARTPRVDLATNPPWLIPLLLAVTALVIGICIGAVLFRR